MLQTLQASSIFRDSFFYHIIQSHRDVPVYFPINNNTIWNVKTAWYGYKSIIVSYLNRRINWL